ACYLAGFRIAFNFWHRRQYFYLKIITINMNTQRAGTHGLFSNPLLEKLSRTHISIPVSLCVIYATALCIWNVKFTSLGMSTSILLFFVGWLTFSWVEYQVRRHVFHLETYSA